MPMDQIIRLNNLLKVPPRFVNPNLMSGLAKLIGAMQRAGLSPMIGSPNPEEPNRRLLIVGWEAGFIRIDETLESPSARCISICMAELAIRCLEDRNTAETGGKP